MITSDVNINPFCIRRQISFVLFFVFSVVCEEGECTADIQERRETYVLDMRL